MHVSIHDYAYRIYSVISLGLPCSTADNETTKRTREIHARIITSDLVGISIPPWRELTSRDSKVTRSIFDHISWTELNTFATAILKDETPLLLRARGAMMSMAVADGIGHNFEFTDVTDKPGSRCLVYPSTTPGGEIRNPHNKFSLVPGQWTDDASMGLCVADSLLSCRNYNGANMRTWFWCWWNQGLSE